MVLLSFEIVINNHFVLSSGCNPTAFFQSNNHTKTKPSETIRITSGNDVNFMFEWGYDDKIWNGLVSVFFTGCKAVMRACPYRIYHPDFSVFFLQHVKKTDRYL